MASGALFGNASGRSQSKNLVEFRAGKMYMKGKTVHPDKRKGLVYVYQSDDSLMHFCWKDRTKGNIEDDLIIFPDDVEFKPVAQCTTGRVYILKFKSSTRKYFFWMQEPKSDKDEEFCRKVNEYLNNPPTPGSNRGSSGGLGALPPELTAGLGESDLQSLLGNMSQQQLMQLLGGMGMGGIGGLPALMGGRPSSSQSDSAPPSRVQSSPGPRPAATIDATPEPQRPVTAAAGIPSQETPAAGSSTGTNSATPTAGQRPDSSIQLSDLQNILSGMGATEGGEAKENVDLTNAVTPDVVIPLLSDADVRERLLPFLPDSENLPRTAEELNNTVQSPQFQQAMTSFSAALASGQLGPLMSQFDMGEDVANAAAQGDVEAFVKAMQAALSKKADKAEEKKEDKEDTEMKE